MNIDELKEKLAKCEETICQYEEELVRINVYRNDLLSMLAKHKKNKENLQKDINKLNNKTII